MSRYLNPIESKWDPTLEIPSTPQILENLLHASYIELHCNLSCLEQLMNGHTPSSIYLYLYMKAHFKNQSPSRKVLFKGKKKNKEVTV